MAKRYWREILIAGLIGLLIWTNANTPTKHTGSSHTVCIIDTLYMEAPVRTIVRYQRRLVPVFDTITSVYTDTLWQYRVDTSWLYADIPVQKYTQGYSLSVSDTSMNSWLISPTTATQRHGRHIADVGIMVRTIGWLDTIAVTLHRPLSSVDSSMKPPQREWPSLWLNLHSTWPTAPDLRPDIAPGVAIQWRQWYGGYNYSTNGTHTISVGHRLW